MRFGYWFALMLSVALAGAFVLTAAGFLPYAIAGETVSRDAWWRIAPVLPVVSAFAAAIAFGIRKRRRWTRHLVMLLWPALALAALASYAGGDIPRSVLVRAVIEPTVLTLLCGWYFYRKPNVVAYFRGL
jgi:uncharacterized membrane protein YoaK (UPF0700 family)